MHWLKMIVNVQSGAGVLSRACHFVRNR